MKKNFLFNALCAMVACAGLAACEKDENPSGNGGNDGGGTDTPSEYTLIANPLSLSFGWNSTSPQTITVTTNAPAFTVGEHPSWYTAVASGNTVVVTPTENDGEARSHELTISAEGAAPVKIRISQDEKGEIAEPYSIAAGLDYPGVGPMHANLIARHRASIVAVNDDEAIRAAYRLTRLEGIIPALESSHALGALDKMKLRPEDVVVLTVSGRGDKDIETYLANPPQ